MERMNTFGYDNDLGSLGGRNCTQSADRSFSNFEITKSMLTVMRNRTGPVKNRIIPSGVLVVVLEV